MADKSTSQHLFADVLARVHAVCGALAAEGQWPASVDLSRVAAKKLLCRAAIGEDRNILFEVIDPSAPPDPLPSSREGSGTGGMNHSCDSNLWMQE